MLRFAFLRSDFNPQILILGDREDLHRFAAELRGFAVGTEDRYALRQQPVAAPDTRTSLVLVRQPDIEGAQAAGAEGSFEWRLNAETIVQVADLVDALAAGDHPAGSQLLETGVDGEVPVNVSLGEFTDDFLVRIS